MRETLINGRWPLMLPTHRADRLEWPWWEATRLAAMATVIGPGSIVWDVGAEEGDFPALWASWGAKVYLAEPNPLVWPNIRLVFEENNLADRVLGCWPGFLADHKGGTPPAYSTSFWPSCAFGDVIGDHGFCRVEERPDLPSTTIDERVASGWLPPTVLTLDIEGAEFLALQGARQTLERHRPEVFVSVHPEFMAHHHGVVDGVGLIASIMEPLSYELTYLCTDHERHEWWRPK